jgi:putative endonuclease
MEPTRAKARSSWAKYSSGHNHPRPEGRGIQAAEYRIHRLVYFEKYDDALTAIHREKCIKKWYRRWKIELIESANPEWNDLYSTIT